MDRPARTARIRQLNDDMRTRGLVPTHGERWMFTAGVLALGPASVAETIRLIREFSEFSRDNDPHGEHDFGSVRVGGTNVFWKIDYYDRTLTEGSPDPADAEVTRRVLTVMLASEY